MIVSLPTRPVSGGRLSTVAYTDFETPLGPMRIAASPAAQGLAGAWFIHDQKYVPPLTSLWVSAPDSALLGEARSEIEAWFEGRQQHFATALAPQGTPFQQAVWRGLLEIGYGETETYSGLTARLGQPATAVRAVAGAIGRNPVSVLIPCHRVLGRDGSLTGYAGGLARKRALLDLEQSGCVVGRPFVLTG